MSGHAFRRLLHNRPRLMAATVAGCATGMLLPASLPLITRILTGWDFAVWSYLLLMGWLMSRANHARVRMLAEREDESAAVVLAVLSLASVVSLAAIAMELATLKDLPTELRLGRYAFTAATVLGSWCLLGIIFTIHYARLYYQAAPEKRPLHFPDREEHPDYWDFLYFSFTIAVAAQTSDVSVHGRAMRKVVLAQSVLSFLFNVAILGLSINIAASMVGS
ncbi:MAG: DUF1345 domain-containing protein [Burkholderiaceae bacterium]|nr:DUF1345 domain-containing protein [Burkholderiaceae bacterium]